MDLSILSSFFGVLLLSINHIPDLPLFLEEKECSKETSCWSRDFGHYHSAVIWSFNFKSFSLFFTRRTLYIHTHTYKCAFFFHIYLLPVLVEGKRGTFVEYPVVGRCCSLFQPCVCSSWFPLRSYCAHFTDEEAGSEKLSNLPESHLSSSEKEWSPGVLV